MWLGVHLSMQVVPGSKTLGEILKEKGGLSKFLFDKSEKKRKDKVFPHLTTLVALVFCTRV